MICERGYARVLRKVVYVCSRKFICETRVVWISRFVLPWSVKQFFFENQFSVCTEYRQHSVRFLNWRFEYFDILFPSCKLFFGFFFRFKNITIGHIFVFVVFLDIFIALWQYVMCHYSYIDSLWITKILNDSTVRLTRLVYVIFSQV